jgi:hypothetical protein
LADEPDLHELRAIGAQAAPARDAWESCTASVIKGELQSERPAEELAQQALRRCKRREAQLLSVLANRIGDQNAVTAISELRNLHRESLISVIEELRRR